MLENSLARRENNVIVRREAISGSEKFFGEFNKVWVSGVLEEEFEFSHEVLWEKFYKTRVVVTRLSGTEDCVPIMVSELLIVNALKKNLKGKYVEAGGQFRSFNRIGKDGRKHLDLYLFVTTINIYDDEEELEEITNANLIFLEGYICKNPVYRTTPFGRKITDLILAVNRNYKKSDYIPCIAWGRGALYVSELKIGDKVNLYGRIQSRQYFKKFSTDSETGEWREAYEVSIMRVIKVDDLRLEG